MIHTAASICSLLSPIWLDATLLVVGTFAEMDDVAEQMVGVIVVVNVACESLVLVSIYIFCLVFWKLFLLFDQIR